ncbi:MAG: SurA N-terminal domain-containing protein [Deltaproteobacteria bacterium]|nr:SurA N-terminal domain-containing protein [Deltaproteobacteria bacterium]
MRTWWAWAVLLSAADALAVETTAPGYREVERVVAVVNEDVILQSEVEERLLPALNTLPASLKGAERQARVEHLRHDALEDLVADKLLQQQIDELHLEVTTEELERAIKEVKAQNGLDDTQFRQALAQQGMTMAVYRDNLRKQLLKAKIINIKVRNRVTATERDLQAGVARRMKTRKVDYKVHARHAAFLVPEGAPPDQVEAARQRALAFHGKVVAGASFDALVKTESDEPSRGGGDLGFFKRGEMNRAFEDAAFSTPPGGTAAPVRSPLGWHVIHVVERKSLDERPRDEVEREMREQLMGEELERAFKRYVSELRNQAHVEVRP